MNRAGANIFRALPFIFTTLMYLGVPLFVVAAETTIFTVSGNVQNGSTISITSAKVNQGLPTPNAANGPDTIVVFSDFNRELYRAGVTLTESFALNLPFFYSAKTVQFQKNGKVTASVGLPKLICAKPAKTGVCTPYCQGRGLDPDCFQCGNGFCDPDETAKTCPIDCPAAAITAPAPAATPPPAPSYTIPVIVGAIIVFGLTGTLVLVRRRRM